jgi:hypothetical protein
MAEILTIAWIYMIYKKERNQKQDFNRKMKQLQEIKKRKYEERIQLGIIHKNLQSSLYEHYMDVLNESKIDKTIDEFIDKQYKMSLMWCRED